ncbi:MAG TPA: orotate phosphoribosyltransferase [Humisphaera sp.]
MTQAAPLSRDAVARRIAEVALLRGEFTLRSGRKSSYYLDKYLFETQPDILLALGKLFADRLPPDTDRLAGPELGAVALAAAVSMASGKPFVLVRNAKKGYGSSKMIEGTLKPGEKVVIIEDILTTGGQIVEAAKNLEAAGAKVIKMLGTIDRLEGARENIEAAGYSYESLFTTKDLGIGGE